MSFYLKKKFSSIFICLIAAAALMVSTAFAAETLDQSNTNQQNNIYFGAAGAGQTFTAGQTGLLSRISIPVQAFPQNCSYYKCGDLTVEIYSSANVFASPSTLIATASIPFSAVSTSSVTWTDITFVNPPAITAGQQYLLHLPAMTASGISAFNARYISNNTYSGGNMMQSDSSRHTMLNYPTFDLAFKTFVTEATLDTLAPTTTDNAPTEAVNQDVVVQLTADDDPNGSGVAATYYTVNGGTQQTGTSVTITENGSHLLSYWSVDKAGNTENKHTKTIIIDKVAPVTSDNAPTDWVNQDVTVNFSSIDLGVGVAATYYIVNGGVQHSGNSVTLTEEGTYSLIYWSVDNAGNIENQQIAAVKIDKSGPEIEILGNTGAYSIDQNIKIICSVEDTLSGVASSNCIDIAGAAHSFILGNNSYTFTAVDYVGNESTLSIHFTISVSSESLGSLIEQIVTNEEVVVSLTEKLAAIQASITKGNEKSKSGQVGAFINQIKAKTGKSITAEQAELLIQLVREL